MTASGLFTPEEIGMVWDYFDANSDEALKLGHRDLDGVKKELLAEQLWFVRNDPEIIKEAYESRKDVKKDEPDNIILLTVYFLLKYPRVSSQNQVEDFEEFLKQQKCPKEEAEQELALMRQYEELLIQNFSRIYGTFADEKNRYFFIR